MEKFTSFLAFILLVSISAKSQNLLRKEKQFLSKLSVLDKNNSKLLECFFDSIAESKNFKQLNLGFNWSLKEFNFKGKNVSFSVKFFKFNDSICSYIIAPCYNYENTSKFKKYLFEYKDNLSGNLKAYINSKSAILKPINGYPFLQTTISEEILELMSPLTEMDFGFPGSDGIAVLSKAKFDKIKLNLTILEVKTMFYSINPVVRLLAIEYYLQKLGNKDIPCEKMKLFGRIFHEFPVVNTRFGCLIEEHPTEFLFPKYYLQKYISQQEVLCKLG